MTMFIKVTTTNDASCIVNTEHIICIIDKTGESPVSIVLDQTIFSDHNCIDVKDDFAVLTAGLLERTPQ